MSTPAQTDHTSSKSKAIDVTFKHLQTIPLPTSAYSLHMRQSSDLSNALLLCGCDDYKVRIYSATIVRPLSGSIHFQLETTITHHTNDVIAVNWHPTKSEFVTASSDKSVVIWDAKDIKHPKVLTTLAHSSVLRAAKYSSTGLLLTGSVDELRLYKCTTPSKFTLLSTYKTDGGAYTVAWHNDLMAALFYKGGSIMVQVWRDSLESKNVVFQHSQTDALWYNHVLQFSPYGTLLCSGNTTNEFYIYNAYCGQYSQVPDTISVPKRALYVEVLRSGMFVTTCRDHKLRVHIGTESIGAFQIGNSTGITHAVLPDNAGYVIVTAICHYNNHHLSVCVAST